MRVIEYSDLKSLKGVSYSTTQLWRLIKAGQFPRPIKIGGGRNAWLEEEVDAYLKARVAARDAVAS
jgi:prophage regulatory protein